MRRSGVLLMVCLGAVLLWSGLRAAPQKPDSTDKPIGDKAVTKYQSAQEEHKMFNLPPDFTIELVAAEPLVINPVCLALDEKGRIYASESHTYRYGPKGSPVKVATNPIVRLDPAADGKGFTRTLIAEGFDDPVMGMLVKDGKLWATANNFLYRFDIDDSGKTTNKATLVTDRNKAWNPFGMFVLEWGHEGMLYMSVGNHGMRLEAPGGEVTSRGSSGVIVRMHPDGSKMEKLVQGLRVPYSFEVDPWGQLWLLSNGEGNPNRFVRVIEGVDYHCYSRGVSNDWLAGNSPLAPPCFELPGGANTQLVRYYGAGMPQEYNGNLFLDNWGRHGFGGANRTLFRYIPDERGTIVKKEPFLECKDPHFRCSHVLVDHDGSLLIADWYGRDDESDLTGRIWRVSYTGKDRPKVEHELASPRWKETEYALAALGSPDHRLRDKAKRELHRPTALAALKQHAATSKEPLGAANALWTLTQIGTPEARAALSAGGDNADWKVRRLALNLLRRYEPKDAATLGAKLQNDSDPGVRVEAALALNDAAKTRSALVEALEAGAAKDVYLRYEAAWHLARHGDAASFKRLLDSTTSDVQLAGLIALDVAIYENFASRAAAQTILNERLATPGTLNLDLLLTLANLHVAPEMAAALTKLAAREDLSPALTAKTLLLVRRCGGKASLNDQAARRFLDGVRSGSVKLTSPAETVVFFELLASEGPTEYALKQLRPRLTDKNPEIRTAAHEVAREFGPKASSLADELWEGVFRSTLKPGEKVPLLGTLAAIEATPQQANWKKILDNSDPLLVRDAIRSWRSFGDNAALKEALLAAVPKIVERHPALKDDVARLLVELKVEPDKITALKLIPRPLDAEVRRKFALEAKATPDNVILGRRVFERAGCVKCHTAISENTLRAPSLKGIGKAQKIDYLIESVLEPSKIIKTGYETEQIVTNDGRTFVGLVKDEGKQLRVIQVDKDVVLDKTKIDTRAVQKLSLMPTGQADGLSQEEFADLMAYLQSLK